MRKKYNKRADGRYLIQVQIGYKPDGRPKFKNIYARTIDKLEKKERDFRQQLDKGIIINDSGLTVGKWADKWLELYKSNVAYNTKDMYRNVINTHIKPEIGMIRLNKLKTHHVQELINKKAAEGLTRTVEKIKLALDQIIKQAIICEFIYRDIMQGVKMPARVKNDKRALTDEEIRIIMAAELPPKEKAFITMLLYTGLRRGEILALNISDLDFVNKCVCVNKTVYFEVNSPVLRMGTKTAAGKRYVPMPDYLITVLEKYLKVHQDTFVLYPDSNGNLMSKAVFRRFWYKTMAEIKKSVKIDDFDVFDLAEDITPHVFRHTYATLLYNSDIDAKIAQSLMGHANYSVTMDIYTHLDEKKALEAREKINRRIHGTV